MKAIQSLVGNADWRAVDAGLKYVSARSLIEPDGVGIRDAVDRDRRPLVDGRFVDL